MKHDVHYAVHDVESQTSIALVCCYRCKKKAKAYDKHFMQVLIEADDCPGERPSPTVEELTAWMEGAKFVEKK